MYKINTVCVRHTWMPVCISTRDILLVVNTICMLYIVFKSWDENDGKVTLECTGCGGRLLL